VNESQDDKKKMMMTRMKRLKGTGREALVVSMVENILSASLYASPTVVVC
jgi:hypothetical protein